MSEKAQSHSKDKKELGQIWAWLDTDFLLEMSKQMLVPIEVLKKYPKNNWKNGRGDKEFQRLRIESAIRHLYEVKKAFDEDRINDAVDLETECHHAAAVAVNMMMLFYTIK